MNRCLLFFIAFSFAVFGANAQADPRQYPGKVKYQKSEQDATIFEFPYPASQVEDGLRDLAASRGVKVKEKYGFLEARNMLMQKLGGTYDVYYKVEKTGKTQSKVYMIVAEPGEDLNNRTTSHAAIVGTTAGGAAIVSAIVPHLEEQDFNLLKMSQEEEVKKAEKKLADLQDEQSRLQKKLSDLNKDIERNVTNQKNATAELEARKKNLTELLNKRGEGKKKG